ncbi:unnamed protein product [Spirodela intermedia]|uniref:BCNT-C domain-containing protein n=1 Tax=Spirodela intermedia TaxID=51605 RepID=A0A7I8J0S2_SPIIN|nr:unnamed protein product [Spirodela intermedia]CAA6663639.1 unnamed protein product [Spirodela intermedia]
MLKADQSTSLKGQAEEKERMARVNAVWKRMNSGLPQRERGPAMCPVSTVRGKEARSAALSAVRDVTSAANSAVKGRVEITEVRDFAGEEVEVKKLVDADSKEAARRPRQWLLAHCLDSILEQIKKKQKLSVLDKTKKDWGNTRRTRAWRRSSTPTRRAPTSTSTRSPSYSERFPGVERERDARLPSRRRGGPTCTTMTMHSISPSSLSLFSLSLSLTSLSNDPARS